jgi:nitrite reductase/ring-hydroxylating ferredoxin subunit
MSPITNSAPLTRQPEIEERLKNCQADIQAGLIPQWVLSDVDVNRLERERIFARSWYFLGHESEIPRPGDFVSRWLAEDPVLLLRDRSGKVSAFSNSCMHRGTILCSADSGNRKSLICPYHGWSYNLQGVLTGVLGGDRVYGSELDRSKWGLRPIPIQIYAGMVFGNLDPAAPPLEDSLGDLKFYLDILMRRTDGGMEVRGAPFRWVVNANWKIGAENFGGDSYHTAMTHRSTVELGVSPKDKLFGSYGHQIVLNHGHGLNVIAPSPSVTTQTPFQGLPEHLWPMFDRNLSPAQVEVFRNTAVLVGNCFPNLSFLSAMHGTGGDAPLTNFLTLRQWRPLGPDKMEVWSWFLSDRDAPAEFREESYKRYVNTFGPAGTFEQDDMEIFTRMTEASKGHLAQDKSLSYNNMMNYVMGLDRVEPDPGWPGPGTAYPTCFLEAVQRAFYEHWNQRMLAS